MPIRYGVFSCDIYEYPKGDMVCYKDYEDLEQENAKLKDKLHNIEEGLRMLDEMLKDRDSLKFFGREGICIEILDPYKCIEAPTLSDLIDAILTGGE